MVLWRLETVGCCLCCCCYCYCCDGCIQLCVFTCGEITTTQSGRSRTMVRYVPPKKGRVANQMVILLLLLFLVARTVIVTMMMMVGGGGGVAVLAAALTVVASRRTKTTSQSSAFDRLSVLPRSTGWATIPHGIAPPCFPFLFDFFKFFPAAAITVPSRNRRTLETFRQH